MEPSLIVLDEPVSALDVSIRAQIINLLDDLQDEFGLSYILVAHDLSIVRHVSQRIAVMYLGKVMELSPAEELYVKPIHPYTRRAAGLDPRSRTRARTAARTRTLPGGEPPDPVAPAARLPLPHALPARHGRVPSGRAAAGRVRGRPSGGLPPSAQRHAGGDRDRAPVGAQPAERVDAWLPCDRDPDPQ